MIREGGDGTSRTGDKDEGGEVDGETDPSLRLPSRVLLANERQHTESFLYFSLGCFFFSFSES